jgi:hypothetical protein
VNEAFERARSERSGSLISQLYEEKSKNGLTDADIKSLVADLFTSGVEKVRIFFNNII